MSNGQVIEHTSFSNTSVEQFDSNNYYGQLLIQRLNKALDADNRCLLLRKAGLYEFNSFSRFYSLVPGGTVIVSDLGMNYLDPNRTFLEDCMSSTIIEELLKLQRKSRWKVKIGSYPQYGYLKTLLDLVICRTQMQNADEAFGRTKDSIP